MILGGIFEFRFDCKKKSKNDDDVIFAGVSGKQRYSLTSWEYNL